MNEKTTPTPAEVMGAIKTLASIDVKELHKGDTDARAWRHVKATLDRYVPNWFRTIGGTGQFSAGESANAAAAIRDLVSGPLSDAIVSQKATAWERFIHALDAFGTAWRKPIGATVEDAAINEVNALYADRETLARARAELQAITSALFAAAPGWADRNAILPPIQRAVLAIEQLGAQVKETSDTNHTRLAWHETVLVLDDVRPGWNAGGNSVSNAKSTIRQLANDANKNCDMTTAIGAWHAVRIALDAHFPDWFIRESGKCIATAATKKIGDLAATIIQNPKDVRVHLSGKVDIQLVQNYLSTLPPILRGRGYAGTVQEHNAYTTAHGELIEAMEASHRILPITSKGAEHGESPFALHGDRIIYAQGWNHCLAEVMTRGRTNPTQVLS